VYVQTGCAGAVPKYDARYIPVYKMVEDVIAVVISPQQTLND